MCRRDRRARCRGVLGRGPHFSFRAADAGAAWCSRDGARWRGATRCRISWSPRRPVSQTRLFHQRWWLGLRGCVRRESAQPCGNAARAAGIFLLICAFPQTHQGRFCFPVDPIDQRIGTEESRSSVPSHRGFSSSVGSPAFYGRTFLMLLIPIHALGRGLKHRMRHSGSPVSMRLPRSRPGGPATGLGPGLFARVGVARAPVVN